MKKVKTVLFSLLIAFACSFMTACSCSMGGGDTGPVEQVLETAIAIECTSGNVEVTNHEETGYLTIRCHKGDKFTIKYTLTPDNATTTRVNWDYEGSDDVLSCDRNTYSQTVSEPVTFVAKNVGNTVIKFESDATKKTTQATVIVGDVPEALPTFVAVSGFRYDTEKAELSWNPVSKQIMANGTETSCVQTGGSVAGFAGYLVHITDLTNGIDLDPRTTEDAAPKIKLDRGIKYAVSVIAKGDNYQVKDSALSEQFKFCQIETPTNLKNENGKITYTAPKYSDKTTVYLNEAENLSISQSYSCDATALTAEFNLNDSGVVKLDKYKISVIAYDLNHSNATGYGETGDGIKYYPSVLSDPIYVTRVVDPTISVENETGDCSVTNSVTFSGANLYSLITWESIVTGFTINYGYAIYKDGNRIIPASTSSAEYVMVDSREFNTNTLWDMNVYGGCTIKIKAFSDPTTTIPSKEVSQAFVSLKPLDSTTKIQNGILDPSSAGGNIYGMELYFVNTSNNGNSKMTFHSAEVSGSYPMSEMGEIDLSKIGLKEGEYDIYGRYVGIPSNINPDRITTTTQIVKISQDPVTVCSSVKNINVTNDGLINFGNVDGINDYTINILQTTPNGTCQLNVKVSKLGALETSSYESPKYSTAPADGKGINWNTVSLYHVIGNALMSANGVNAENIQSAVTSFTYFENSFKISVTANKEGCISSAESSNVTMQRVKPVENITLENYVLKFKRTENLVAYVIAIGDYSVTIGENQTTDIAINLNDTEFTNGSETKYGKDLVSGTDATTFEIYAVGYSTDNGDADGRLDSIVTEVSFRPTPTPTNLKLNDNGTLTFETTDAIKTEVRTFTLTLTSGKQTRVIENVEATLVDITNGEENGGEPATQAEGGVQTLTYAITGIKDYLIGGDGKPSFIDKVTEITLVENSIHHFNGKSSEKYYAYMMPKLDITKTLKDEVNPAIKYSAITAINGVIYRLVIASEQFPANADANNEKVKIYTKAPNTNILLSEVLSQNDPATILAGEYAFTLNPSYTNAFNSGSDDEAPFVFLGESSTLTIIVKSREITATANGKEVTWESIDDNATYQISYLRSGESTWSTPADTETTTSHTVKNLLVAGDNSVRIIPTITYTDHGVILVGEIYTNTIKKLKTPDNFATSNGELVFYTHNEGLTSSENIVLNINGAELNVGQYKITGEDVKEETEVDGVATSVYRYTKWTVTNIAAEFVGELKIKATITASGNIDSDESSVYNATKLAPPADIIKTGNKIYWTPVENAMQYNLLINDKGYTLVIESGNYKVTGLLPNGTDGEGNPIIEETTLVDSSLFGLEDGKLYFYFDESVIVAGVAGIYNVTISAVTETPNYLNSSTSAPYTITKLNNVVTVEPTTNNTSGLIIKGYDNLGNTDPISVTYTIERYTVVEKPVESTEGEGESEGEGEGATPPSTEPVIEVLESYTLSEPISYESMKNLITGEGTGYFIDFDSIEDLNGDLIFTEDGTYRIFITFLGNKDNLLDSEVFKKDGFVKLSKSTLHTSNGVLTWGSASESTQGTNNYSLHIKQVGVEDAYIQIDGITLDATSNLATLTDEVIANYNTNNPDKTFSFTTGVLYSIKVRNNGSGKISSSWSDEFKVMKLQAPNTLTVSMNSQGKSELSWKDNNNSAFKSNYNFAMFAEDNTSKREEVIYNTSGDSATLKCIELYTNVEVGTYTLRMQTIGNSTIGNSSIGLLSSDFTDDNNSKQIKYIANTSNPGVVSGGLVWDAVEGVSGGIGKYKLTITSSNGDTVKYTTETKYSFLKSDITLEGGYTITVDAITDPSVAIISTLENVGHSKTTTLYSSKQLTDLMVKDGNLSWSIPIADIKEFVSANKENIVEVAKEKLGISNVNEDLITNAIIMYVMSIVNDGNIAENPELLDFLSFMYSFNMNINGVDTVVYADSVEAVIVTGENENKTYTPVQNNYLSAHRLMFTYIPRLTAEVLEENGGSIEESKTATNPGRYEIKVAGKGNSTRFASAETPEVVDESAKITTFAVTSSNYTEELVVYKPNTPKTWVREDGSNEPVTIEDGDDLPTDETPEVSEQTKPRGIVNGDVLWGLVTTDNSYINVDKDGNLVGNYDFHKNYEIIAKPVDNPNSLGVKINVNSDDTYDTKESTNPNLFDGHRYYRNIKDLFSTEGGANHVAPNTNYTLTIGVRGTVDSSVITNSKEKIYLNSDKYQYQNVMNILKNENINVKNSIYNWSNSNGSTATKVVIYGPFDYAPIDAEDLTKTENVNNIAKFKSSNPDTTLTDAEILLNIWKTNIQSSWNNLFDPKYAPNAGDPRRIERVFSNDTSASGQNSLTITKEIENYIADATDFGAGGYIIRKQELGDGRGVVDTDFDEKNLFVNGEPEYGVIANKLDKVTPVDGSWLGKVEYNKDNVTTATQGKFVWNSVPRANAYQITLKEMNGNDVYQSLQVLVRDNDPSDNNIMTYDLPDLSYSDPTCKYSIDIVAVRMEGENLVDNYFNSDSVTTTAYSRIMAPTGLKITGDGQISWNADSSNNVSSYLIRVNDNQDQQLLVEYQGYVSQNNTILVNIGDMKEDATYRISIKVVASLGFINSSYTQYVEITKLGSPNAKIVNGEFTWGPDGGEISGANPTETNFILSGESSITETLNAEVTSYPLYTEISSYDQVYSASEEIYPAGEYTFSVQFKGSVGEMIPGQSYYIVSKATQYNATKLPTPVIEASDNTDGENKIKWNAIENATGYKVFIIDTDNISYSEIIPNDNTTLINIKDGVVTLSLDKFLERESTNKFIEKLTTGVKVYVQAIGTIDGNEDTIGTQYVNSSYSNPETYKTPNPAIEGTYNSNTGVIGWNLLESDKKDMDIFLVTKYIVEGVSEDEYTNYWTQSIGGDNDIIRTLGISNRSVTAKSRTITQGDDTITVYDLEVIDTIYLECIGGQTPTSYQLTNYGTRYVIDVVVMSAYSSQAYTFGYLTDKDGNLDENRPGAIAINFTIFNGGDGTENLPYNIHNENALIAIKDFKNSHFKLVNDIELTSKNNSVIPTTWDMITEFNGVIDGANPEGGNFAIKNVITPNGFANNSSALFDTLNGTIRNVNIQLSTKIDNFTGDIYAAGVAIVNNGIIDNVHVEGNITAITTSGSVNVGGIAVDNYNTINNSSFTMVDDDKFIVKGIYASTGDTKASAKVGGIAVRNGNHNNEIVGNISNSYFDGNISANLIGGIAHESYGTIEKCYAVGNVEVFNGNNNAVRFGGIVGLLYGSSAIKNSYTQLSVKINVESSANGPIAGLVGSVDETSITDGATISGCYVVVDFACIGEDNSAVTTYAFMKNDSNITYEDNCYHTKAVIGINLNNDNITSGVTAVTTIEGLNNALANVKDSENNKVYNTENKDVYPTFA